MEAHRVAFEAAVGGGDDSLVGLHEVSMPVSQSIRVFPNSTVAPDTGNVRYRPEHMFSKTYGRSLLGGYSQRYAPDFILHGLPTMNFMEPLVDDLKLAVRVCLFPVSYFECGFYAASHSG